MRRFANLFCGNAWIGAENRVMFSSQFCDTFRVQLELSEYTGNCDGQRIITAKEKYHQLVEDLFDEGFIWGIGGSLASKLASILFNCRPDYGSWAIASGVYTVCDKRSEMFEELVSLTLYDQFEQRGNPPQKLARAQSYFHAAQLLAVSDSERGGI